jgi:hypothetical protein
MLSEPDQRGRSSKSINVLFSANCRKSVPADHDQFPGMETI